MKRLDESSPTKVNRALAYVENSHRSAPLYSCTVVVLRTIRVCGGSVFMPSFVF